MRTGYSLRDLAMWARSQPQGDMDRFRAAVAGRDMHAPQGDDRYQPPYIPGPTIPAPGGDLNRPPYIPGPIMPPPTGGDLYRPPYIPGPIVRPPGGDLNRPPYIPGPIVQPPAVDRRLTGTAPRPDDILRLLRTPRG